MSVTGSQHRLSLQGGPARAAVRRALFVLFSLTLVACRDTHEGPPPVSRENPVVPLDSGTVFIQTGSDTLTLSVEIAETPNQRQIGLMERLHLPADEGMFFLSREESDSTRGFWMFRTHIPLDIAYLGQDGQIVAIRQMEPCPSPYASACRTYPAGVPFYGALEVNAGYFEANGVGIGDRVTLRRGGAPPSPAPDELPR